MISSLINTSHSRKYSYEIPHKTFTEQLLLENIKFLRGVTFGTATFLVEEFFRIQLSSEEVLFQSRYFCTASTFSEEPHFGKCQFFRKAVFCVTCSFWKSTFSQRLLFQKKLPSIETTFLQELHFQNSYYFRATIPFHSHTSYISVSN